MKFTLEELESRYEKLTASVTCSCEFATELVGGQPADDAGLRAYVKYALKLENPFEIEKAVARIRAEEIGERPVEWAAGEGELTEKQTYDVNVIRRSDHGSYLLNHMIQAGIKQAASRLKLTVEYRGSKGNLAEAGRVFATGISLLEEDRPDRVYLISPEGVPAATHWNDFRGRVNTPQGAKSIIHHSECAPVGTRFDFEYRFLLGDFTADDVGDMIAMSMNQGIGSARSLGCGRFRILSMEFEEARLQKRNKKKKVVEA